MSEEHNHLSRMADIVSAKDIRKTFRNTGEPLEILRGIDLTAHQGEMIAIVGESGSGKSTLLHILGALDRPSEGSVHFGETDIYCLNPEALAEFRRHSIGFIFQFVYIFVAGIIGNWLYWLLISFAIIVSQDDFRKMERYVERFAQSAIP